MCMTFRSDGRGVPVTAGITAIGSTVRRLPGVDTAALAPGPGIAGDSRSRHDSAPTGMTAAGPHNLGVMGMLVPGLDTGTGPGDGAIRNAVERLVRALAIGFAVLSIGVAAFLVVFTWWVLVMQPGPVIARQGYVTMPLFPQTAPLPPGDNRRES